MGAKFVWKGAVFEIAMVIIWQNLTVLYVGIPMKTINEDYSMHSKYMLAMDHWILR